MIKRQVMVAAIDPMTRGLKELLELKAAVEAAEVAAIDPMTRGLKDHQGGSGCDRGPGCSH